MKKWIEFKVIAEKPKTKIYAVLSLYDNTELGKIYWYGRWRQYVFEPNAETIWSDECLKELYNFLCNLKEKRKIAPIPPTDKSVGILGGSL